MRKFMHVHYVFQNGRINIDDFLYGNSGFRQVIL